MKIVKITYPVELDKIPDCLNDNIDIFVEVDNGICFTLTVSTPGFYESYMRKEKLTYLPAAPPDIIVSELTHENIYNALATYCDDNGYWLKLYALMGLREGILANNKLDELVEKYIVSPQ